MRGTLIFQTIQQDYEELTKKFGAMPNLFACGLECHYGHNKDKQEQLEEAEKEDLPKDTDPPAEQAIGLKKI